MQVINDAGLPEPVFRALSNEGYDAPKLPYHISVTELISAPRRVELRRRHSDKIIEKASMRVWTMMGHAVHLVIKLMETDDCITEQRFYMEIEGWIVTGQTDLYEMVGTLSDFKNSGVFTFQRGDKEEHLQQLNMNAMLFRNEGYEVNKLQIVAFLRDFMQAKADSIPSYPQSAVLVKPYELWSQNKAEVFAARRVKLHQEARLLPDDQLPECSDEEKWYRGEAFAVYGEGNVKSSPGGTFTTEFHKDEAKSKAEAFAREMTTKNTNEKTGAVKKRYEVRHREGMPVRCLKYCSAAPFCSIHQAYLAAHPEPAEGDSEE